jgi:protein phosphatase PTC7
MQPHFQKVAKGGEDAASLSENVLAVADGVGGWAESGIDPAIFSKRLCKNIDELIKKNENYIYDPKRLIIDAVSSNHETGSSTCVVVSLDKHKPLIYTANIGDSGYMLLRKSGLDLI